MTLPLKAIRPVPPLLEILDKYEAETQFSLPVSYRAFARVFGPGWFAGHYRVFIPGYPSSDAGDLTSFQAQVAQARPALSVVYSDAEFIGRMLPFGDTFMGDLFAWNPSVVTDKTACERAIYCLPTGSNEVKRVADTFREFLEGGPPASRAGLGTVRFRPFSPTKLRPEEIRRLLGADVLGPPLVRRPQQQTRKPERIRRLKDSPRKKTRGKKPRK